MFNQTGEKKYRDEVLQDLALRFGHVISVRHLHSILGFASYDALKQAVLRGDLELKLFYIQGRRARHAMATDVADWLTLQWRTSRDQPLSAPNSQPFKEKTMPTG
jgi:hypothetical protein